jgi:Na+/melibiose symporter-like transporter
MNTNITNSDTKEAPIKKMFFYSFGNIVSTFFITAYSTLIFYYYEVEIGLPVLLVSLALIVFALFNMISVPLLGWLTDRPFRWTRRLGFRAPWIIMSTFPALIFYFFLFTPPHVDVKTNPWPIFWYMVIFSCLYNIFYSIYRMHYYGGFANIFRGESERKKATMINWLVASPINIVLSVLPFIFIVYGDRSTFVLTAIISISIMLICNILTIPGVIESEEIKNRYIQGFGIDKGSYRELLSITFRSKNFMVSLCSFAGAIIAMGISTASTIYFFKDVLQVPLQQAIIPSIVMYLAMILSMPLWSRFSRNRDYTTIYLIGIILTLISYIPLLWITTIEELIVVFIIRGIATSCCVLMMMPIVSDCYDEITLACGRHQEATLQSFRTIIYRSSPLFEALVIGLVHFATYYDPTPNAVQTPLAVWGVRVHTALIPILLLIISIIAILFYDLKGDKKTALKENLHKKGL